MQCNTRAKNVVVRCGSVENGATAVHAACAPPGDPARCKDFATPLCNCGRVEQERDPLIGGNRLPSRLLRGIPPEGGRACREDAWVELDAKLSLLRRPLRTLETLLSELLRLRCPEDGRELCLDGLAEGKLVGQWLLGGAHKEAPDKSSHLVTDTLGGREGGSSAGELALATMGFRTSVTSREMLRSTP